MPQNKNYTINSLKSDGKVHRTWQAEVVSEVNDLITFKGVFEREVRHPNLGLIRRGTISYEFYWKSRWYNIFRFHEPEGDLRNYYCNVNRPPTVENRVLSYVDLDIDVLVWKDLSLEILDLDEYEENARRFSYTPQLRERVDKTLLEILGLIKNKTFPFDYIEPADSTCI